ncbi:uncharacterized protein LOC121053207 isoform X1 [Oryza brachyantha]|uniref:uncharacterized protein LOC121053220 isoform X5 n=1 Tax=Oryza brachyantha TaxID=4533 RepID=UPI001ADC481F|nr:uncharacterized protein LOC121053220 isoform X5 [Oryza brachyantha]XP_040379942.1 uncharacterized protein LOC121054438 isoform X1 [Oryza brachyantha]XP_040379943.1 uncharacterized protein LOC121054438 isoform X1 [Oryza brachyantha]XP_040379951.1 uncharacterized protein LOC121053207 isoform X1 [Oryza brachyantha]
MWELAEVPGSNDLGWTFLVAVKREPLSGFHSAALPDKLHITYEYLQWQSFAIKNQTTVMFFIMGILLHQMNGYSFTKSSNENGDGLVQFQDSRVHLPLSSPATIYFVPYGLNAYLMSVCRKLEGNDVIEATIRVQVDLVFYVICNLLLTR